jgi:hypothetical protein
MDSQEIRDFLTMEVVFYFGDHLPPKVPYLWDISLISLIEDKMKSVSHEMTSWLSFSNT